MTRPPSLVALLLVLGCASYQYVEPEDAAPEDEAPGDLQGLGNSGGASGGKPGLTKAGGGAGGSPMSSSAGRGGSSTAGRSGSTASNEGGEGGDDGGSDGGGGSASGGKAGGESAPPLCDEATATPMAAMNASSTVLSDVCLKISIAADQTWITKVTLQPEFGTYPLPFTWTNCKSTGSGAFTANYGNQVIQPVNLACPILVKLGGNAAQQVNVQWWGG